MTVVGTRPEIIRLSRVIARLDQVVDHVLVHTGQNYDYNLNEIFFQDLGIRKPDHYLGVDTTTLGTVLGETLIKTEQVLRSELPDAVLVLGDTNSCISALMAKRLRIPVYHMEAGNRCFDSNVPEETNRKLVDHVADFNLVYTEHARRNLLAEGLPARRVMKTGSPMKEVLTYYRRAIEASRALEDLRIREGEYFLASIHREENVDNHERLHAVIACLVAVSQAFSKPVIVSTHPRTRKRLLAFDIQSSSEDIRFMDPMGFHDYNHLQMHAACCLSDSGTISEESAILGFGAVTLRESIERPEALDAGSIVMTGLDAENVVEAVRLVMGPNGTAQSGSLPEDYEIDNCSERVVRFMISTIKRHALWAGIR